jgi:tRNA threonylcarbamoyladenosine biosynthesis protein TsaB
MRVLTISSAFGGADMAVVEAGLIVARGRETEAMGLAAALPLAAEAVLTKAGGAIDAVAVIVGPGSFTGLRAGIAVAAGIGLALDVPVVGVTVSEALAASLPELDRRTLWTAIEARRGRIFIDQGAGFHGWSIDAVPASSGRTAVCGNAANLVAAALAARGTDVMLTAMREPQPDHIAAVAMRRQAGDLPPLLAEPLYVDAPEARLPAGGLRAAPV